MARERKYEPAAEDARDYPADFNTVLETGGRPLHAHFGHWVADKTEAETHFKTKKELDAFILGAQFGIRYRMDHQAALDGAHAFHEEQREARAQEAAAKPKRQTRAKAEDAEDEAEEAPAPKRRGRPAKAAAAEEAPKAPARRGRAAAAAKPAATTEAPARPARRAATTGAKGRARRGGTKPEADF